MEYVSVEVAAYQDGELLKAMNKDAELNQDQKNIMTGADVGSEISVSIRYVPENTLKHNDVKSFDFTFTIEPEHEARYPGGESKLKEYLKDHAIDGIPDGTFEDLDLAAVKFSIDEDGQVVGVGIFEPSKDEKVDHLLVDVVTNMPGWQPAKYADGTKVRQDFVLTVGSMENCMVNLLNIRLDQ